MIELHRWILQLVYEYRRDNYDPPEWIRVRPELYREIVCSFDPMTGIYYVNPANGRLTLYGLTLCAGEPEEVGHGPMYPPPIVPTSATILGAVIV